MSRNYLDQSLASARRIFGVHIGHSVTAFNRCVGKAMKGASGDKAAIQEKFKSAARSCGKGG
jgi:hypothetical protein